MRNVPPGTRTMSSPAVRRSGDRSSIDATRFPRVVHDHISPVTAWQTGARNEGSDDGSTTPKADHRGTSAHCWAKGLRCVWLSRGQASTVAEHIAIAGRHWDHRWRSKFLA